MASSYSTSAFVAHGSWSAETRKHAAFRFLERLAKDFFDTGDHSKMPDYIAEEYSSVTTHGEHIASSREDAFVFGAANFFKGRLSAWEHIPYTMIAIELKDGWNVLIQCNIFANVEGNLAKGEKKIKDDQGKEWDVKLPVFYDFDLVKVPGAKCEGLKLRHTKFAKDTGTINDILDKRSVKRTQTAKAHSR